MAVELRHRRDRHCKHFNNGDKTFTGLFAAHLHYHDGREWQDVVLDWAGNRSDRCQVITEVLPDGLRLTDRGTGKGIQWLASGITTSTGRAHVTTQGQDWTWQLGPVGVKFSASVAQRIGVREFVWPFKVAGDHALTVDEGGNLVSDAIKIHRPTIIGADGSLYPVGSWRLYGSAAAFTVDDMALPDAAIPYLLDPTTTFTLTTSLDDGWVNQQDTVYPPTQGAGSSLQNTTAYIFSKKDDSAGTFSAAVGLMRWDTSSLTSSATVSSAKMTVTAHSVTNQSDDSRNVICDYYDFGGTTVHYADWLALVGTTAHTGTAITAFTANTAKDLTLSNVGSISKTGFTGIRSGVDGGQPTGINEARWYSADNGSNQPQLVVTYTTTDIKSDTMSITLVPTMTEAPTEKPTESMSATLVPTMTEVPTEKPTDAMSATLVPTMVETVAEKPTDNMTATLVPTMTETPVEMPTDAMTATLIPSMVEAFHDFYSMSMSVTLILNEQEVQKELWNRMGISGLSGLSGELI